MTNPQKIEGGWKKALKKDFDNLLVKEFSTRWREERLVREIEIDIMGFKNIEDFISDLLASERQRCVEEIRDWAIDNGITDKKSFVALLKYLEQLK